MRCVSRASFACCGTLILLLALHGCNRSGPATDGPVTPQAFATPSIADEPRAELQVQRARLGKGGTLDGVLTDLGVDAPPRADLLALLREQLDVRRLPRETGVAVVRDPDGALKRVTCRPDPERFLRLAPGLDGAWTAVWVEVPVRTTIETAGGIVEQSVAQALSSASHGMLLTLAFADIFQWDVDLLVDPRPGDRVQIVYETRRIGELPPDLPSYGGAESRPGQFLALGRILAAAYLGSAARSSAFWIESESGRSGYFDEQGQPLRKTFLKSPLNYRRVSSGFSSARRNPVTRRVAPHHGVDFAARAGTPVAATADGKIRSAGWQGPLGRTVRIRHAAGYETVYGHLSRFAKGVQAGVEVLQNQVIGYVGSTGRATGPHLHYTMRHRRRAIDPMSFRSPPAEPLDPGLMPLLHRTRARWQPLLQSIHPPDLGINLAASFDERDGGATGSGI